MEQLLAGQVEPIIAPFLKHKQVPPPSNWIGVRHHDIQLRLCFLSALIFWSDQPLRNIESASKLAVQKHSSPAVHRFIQSI